MAASLTASAIPSLTSDCTTGLPASSSSSSSSLQFPVHLRRVRIRTNGLSGRRILPPVVKIDTEKYPSIADKYGIQALPTFIIFKDGEPYDRFEGALNAEQLIARIETALKVKQ